MNLLSRSCI